MRFNFTRVSKNSKTGPIPTVMISRESCPPSCPLYDAGCYARGGMVRLHWDKVDARGVTFDVLLDKIRALPKNQVWRYAVAGDLPGVGEEVSWDLVKLVLANRGRKGFTYTHKNPYEPENAALIALANREGFTINLSSNNVSQADQYLRLGIAPVVTLMPSEAGEWRHAVTPGGGKVVRCPAEYSDEIQCSNCGGQAGPLCRRADRKFVVGFTAHGVSKRAVSAVARKGLSIIQDGA